MNTDNSIFLVMPCFNEAGIIRETIEGILRKKYTIVIVDDGSVDNTKVVLQGLPVYYLRHEVNLGQGAALNTGINFALKLRASLIVTFDADGQHDIEDIESMLCTLRQHEAGIVFGSRFLKGAKTNVPLIRKLILRIARLINYFASGILLTDANNGLRLMTAEAASQLQITENRSTHSAQIQNLVKQHKIKYAECPVNISYSTYSMQKGIKNIASVRILYELILFKLFR